MAGLSVDDGQGGTITTDPNTGLIIQQTETGKVSVGGTDPGVLGAAYRQQDPITSYALSPSVWEKWNPTDKTPVETDQLMDQMDKDGVFARGEEKAFLDVKTQGQYQAMLRQLDQERKDRQTLDEAGMFGTEVQVMAGIFQPLSMLPMGKVGQGIEAAANIAPRGYKAIAAGLASSASAVAISGAQEAALHYSQELRTVDESLQNIGGAAILGGVLGYGGARLVLADPAERTTVERLLANTTKLWRTDRFGEEMYKRAITSAQSVYDDTMLKISAPTTPASIIPQLQNEARAALDKVTDLGEQLRTLQGLTPLQTGPLDAVRTAAVRTLGKIRPNLLDPFDTAYRQSASPAFRQAMEKMVDVPQFMQKHLLGEASPVGANVEKEFYRGALAMVRDEIYGGGIREAGASKAGLGQSWYAKWVQSGGKGGKEAFEKELALARVSGDVHPGGNQVITDLAKRLRKVVTGPMEEALNKVGLLDKQGPEVKGAQSHMPRIYRAQEIMGPDGKGTAFRNESAKGVFQERLAELKQQAQATGTPITQAQVDEAVRYAKRIAKDHFDTITKTDVSEFTGKVKGGGIDSLKGRVVPIDDVTLIKNNWISTDLHSTLISPVESLAKKLAIAERFDGDYKAAAVRKAIEADYAGHLENITSPQERELLLKKRDRDLHVFDNTIEQFVGGGGDSVSPRLSWADKAVEAVKTYQAVRLMGNVLTASLPELSNMVMRQGPGRLAMTLFDQFWQNAKQLNPNLFKLSSVSKEEFKRWGAAMEWATNERFASAADTVAGMADPGTDKFMRGLRGISNTFSATTGNLPFTDWMKGTVSRSRADMVLKSGERGWSNLSKTTQRDLAFLGIDEPMLDRIHQAWQSQVPDLHDGFLRHAAMSTWQDEGAAKALAGAIVKESNHTVTTPQLGAHAQGLSSKLGGLVWQFMKFNMDFSLKTTAQMEQRIMANPFGADAGKTYLALSMYIAMGAMAEQFYRWGRDGYGAGIQASDKPDQHQQRTYDNPGEFWSRAIDRAGILGAFGMVNNYTERMGYPGVTRLLQKMGEDQSLQQPRNAAFLDRSPFENLFGPSLSQLSDAMRTGKHLAGYLNTGDTDQFKRRDISTLRNGLPWQNHILLRHLFDHGERALAEHYGFEYEKP